MTVRQSLLAILDQGPCYGYQLRAEYARRTGDVRTVNVGQVYNTLDRLERDGLVQKGPTDERGHVYYEITSAGRDDVHRWLAQPLPATPADDDLVAKMTLAVSLPGVDARTIVADQRRATAHELDRARSSERGDPRGSAGGVIRSLAAQARILRLESDLAWLDLLLGSLASDAEAGRLTVSAEPPRRGRPPARPSPTD